MVLVGKASRRKQSHLFNMNPLPLRTTKSLTNRELVRVVKGISDGANREGCPIVLVEKATRQIRANMKKPLPKAMNTTTSLTNHETVRVVRGISDCASREGLFFLSSVSIVPNTSVVTLIIGITQLTHSLPHADSTHNH